MIYDIRQTTSYAYESAVTRARHVLHLVPVARVMGAAVDPQKGAVDAQLTRPAERLFTSRARAWQVARSRRISTWQADWRARSWTVDWT